MKLLDLSDSLECTKKTCPEVRGFPEPSELTFCLCDTHQTVWESRLVTLNRGLQWVRMDRPPAHLLEKFSKLSDAPTTEKATE